MAGQLKGSRELRARLKAVRVAFKPMGRKWADDTAKMAKADAPVRSGRGKRSIKRRHASQKKATVYANFYMHILDVGAKPHVIKARKARSLRLETGGRTIFTKRVNHPGVSARHFAAKAANKALRLHVNAQALIDEWNAAA